RRRHTMMTALRYPGAPRLTIAVVVPLVLVPLVDATQGWRKVGRTSAVLDGTPLEDARITGRLATSVDYYGGYVVDAIDENSEFYASGQANLTSAFEAERAAQAGDEDSAGSAGGAGQGATDAHGLASPEPSGPGGGPGG